jgi:hypothetical protein
MHPRVRRDFPRVGQLDQYGRHVAAFLHDRHISAALSRVASRATVGRRPNCPATAPGAPHWCAASRGKGTASNVQDRAGKSRKVLLIGAGGLRLAPHRAGLPVIGQLHAFAAINSQNAPQPPVFQLCFCSGRNDRTNQFHNYHMGQAEQPTCLGCGAFLIPALPPGDKGPRTFQRFECVGPDPMKTAEWCLNATGTFRDCSALGMAAIVGFGFLNALITAGPALAGLSAEDECSWDFQVDGVPQGKVLKLRGSALHANSRWNHRARPPQLAASVGLSPACGWPAVLTGFPLRHGVRGPPQHSELLVLSARERFVVGVCTENLIRVDAVMESPKLAE